MQLTTDTIETYIKFNSSIDTQVQSNKDRLRELADKRIRLEERIEKLTQLIKKTLGEIFLNQDFRDS